MDLGQPLSAQETAGVMIEMLQRLTNLSFEEEVINPGFTKWHIKGLPVAAAIHIFTEANDEYPHCHPWDFVSTVIRGAYLEERFFIDEKGGWTSDKVLREHGKSHHVKATTIHRVIELPYGTCWTFVVQEPKIKDWLLWDFREDGIYKRLPQGEFEKI